MVRVFSAIILAATLIGCQTTSSVVDGPEAQRYKEIIAKYCVWTNTSGFKFADERMTRVVISSVVDGVVDGQSGWKRVQFFDAGNASNLYVDTNTNKSYCGLSFQKAGYGKFRVTR